MNATLSWAMHGSLRREGKKKKKRKHHDTLIVIVENGMSSAISKIRSNGLRLWLVCYITVLPTSKGPSRSALAARIYTRANILFHQQ